MKKNKIEEEDSCVEEKGKKKKGLRFLVSRRSEVDRSRIKVGLLDESYE